MAVASSCVIEDRVAGLRGPVHLRRVKVLRRQLEKAFLAVVALLEAVKDRSISAR